mmetsp:Transcript_87782/g.146520  ORF Transcript_87782/g.146520 Transcript_87782/m.146520 type:complete len:515 (-) Transcript_87782:195-1739(-)
MGSDKEPSPSLEGLSGLLPKSCGLRLQSGGMGRELCTAKPFQPFVTLFSEEAVLTACTRCNPKDDCVHCDRCACACGCACLTAAQRRRRSSVDRVALWKERTALYAALPEVAEQYSVPLQHLQMLVKYVVPNSAVAAQAAFGTITALHAPAPAPEVVEAAKAVWKAMPKSSQAKHKAPALAMLLSRFAGNTFGVDEQGHCCGLCPIISLCNHHCQPNCVMATIKGCLSLRTVREVQAGEPLTISYINGGGDPVLLPIFHRRTLVQRAWGFVCQCSRCTADFDDTRVFNCPTCTAEEKEGYLYAGSQDRCPGETDAAEEEQDPHEESTGAQAAAGAWCCRSCGAAATAEVRQQLLEAERGVYQLLHKADDGEGDDDEPQEMTTLLHTAHYLSAEVMIGQMDYISDDAEALQAVLEQLLHTEYFMYHRPTVNTILYHKQLADLYTKCDLKDRALEEHEAAYDELCQLKGEQSEDVQTVQQFLDSFLITCGKATEGGPEALCGNWVRNRKANKSILQ